MNFKMVNGSFLYQASFSYDRIKLLGSEMEDLEFIRPNRYVAPLTYRNYIRVNRKEYYKDIGSTNHAIEDIEKYAEFSSELWDHQFPIRQFILERKQCIIAAEPRTGKTLPSIDSCIIFLKSLPNRKPNELIYWLAPKSGIKSVTDELDKWYGGKENFERAHNVTLCLMTYEYWRTNWFNIKKLKLKTGKDWEDLQITLSKTKRLIPRICIFDEVHKLKSEKGVQGGLGRFMRIAQEFIYEKEFMTVGLSGTPSPKEPSDWWNILELTNPGFIRENSSDALKDRLAEIYMKVDQNSGLAFPAVAGWKDDELEKFSKEISPIVFTLWKNDVLDLPKKDHVFIELKQSKETKQAIRFLESTELAGAQLRQKLRQISDGFLYQNDYVVETNLIERSVIPIDTPKVDQLKLDLMDFSLGKFPWQKDVVPENPRVMITGGYRGTIDIIRTTCIELEWNVLELTGQGWCVYLAQDKGKRSGNRDMAIKILPFFDRSKGLVDTRKWAVIGHPKSMATGLELSMCPLMIAFSHTDDGESEMQVSERPHSNNMDKELGFHIRHYCHVKYDLLIAKALRDKKRFQSITMADIRESLRQDMFEGVYL